MTADQTSLGVVLRIDAKVCHVEVDGHTHVLPLRGRLFEERGAAAPVAVGDRVRVRTGDSGVIEERLPRTSKLARGRRSDPDNEQVIAANVSLVLVVAAAVEPPFQPELVDRILAGAEREKVAAVLVVTKVDRDRKERRLVWTALYRGLGYRVIETGVAEGQRTESALAELGELVHHNTTVLCGASGVGKSSLINTLCPGLDLRIGSISRLRHGAHTTTHSQLVPLPGGGYLLDTPGIRGFGLHCADAQEVQFLFREIAPLVGQCEYRNCRHGNESSCAVRAGLDAGRVAPSRYASYSALVEGLSLSGRKS